MTIGNKRVARGFVCVLIAGFCGISGLQAQEISKYDLEKRAQHHFDNHRYDKAATDYQVLHDMYPKDAEYSYFLGRSFLQSNQQLNEAVNLLKFAATRNYGADTYFYLGKAYHCSYRFEDAVLAFITFRKTANLRDLKSHDLEYCIGVSTQAKQEVQLAQQLEVEEKNEVSANTLEAAFKDINGGKYIYVPDEFRSEIDKEKNYQSLMFLPETIEIDDYVYYSSYNKNGKQGLQIYRAQRINEKEYSLPEPLPGVVNTEFDEAYPYYHKETNTLYFSSNRTSTMGGYDIYSTHYIFKKNEWASPDKKAFPINSVHDDILFTPAGNNVAHFISNRNTIQNSYEAFTIRSDSPVEYSTPENNDVVMALSKLPLSNITSSSDTEVLLAENTVELNESVTETEPTAKPVEQGYGSTLERAMELQTHSDSLAAIVKTLRLKARDEHNYQKKQKLIAGICSLEKEGKRLQQMADDKFVEAEQERLTTVQEIEPKPEETVIITNTNNGITRIANTTMNTTVEEVKKPQEQDYNAGYEAAKSTGELIADQFSIVGNSPYSKNNPIPEASNPVGLIYRIQLGAYANEIPDNTFGGLSPVSKSKVNSGTKYFVGFFTSVQEARDALGKVKQYGYPDAFLVSFYKNDRISVQQAREIEFSKQ